MPEPPSSNSTLSIANLQGVLDRELHIEEVHADLEDEQSIVPELVDADFEQHDPHEETLGEPSSSTLPSIHDIAKGVCDKTDKDYRGLMELCSKFLVESRYISSAIEFFSDNPISSAPTLICLWILAECDPVNVRNQAVKEPRASYSHAQKMRACMTYAFGRIHGLGKQAWHESRGPDGKVETSGNPSVSELVSRYMLSLHRRKVQRGEISTSARAIDTRILEKLYDFNMGTYYELQPYQPGNREQQHNIHHWGGPIARRALHAIYLLAFFCLLRIDEALKIQFDQISLDDDKLVLTLWYRKTHQYGDIKPFVLHRLEDYDSYLCPVRAVGEWIKASQTTQGYLFRRMVSCDRPTASNKPMTSEQFLLMFRHNLMDIGIEPGPFGTHSFRRGGCQYFATGRRWSLRRICEWGGWSQEFTNLTIVKYLISWNDNPNEDRNNFLAPNQRATVKCPECGRSCPCT